MPEIVAVSLGELWLPILLSAVFVFIVSSVIHMATPLHKNDFGALPNEDSVLESMRRNNVGAGSYRFPYCTSMKAMSDQAFLDKMARGPVGTMTLWPPGPMKMGGALAQWFGYSLLISFFVAYIASMTLPAGVPYERVFRVTGTIAILGYAFSNVSNSIWKGERWSVTLKFMFDGLLYGLFTAGTFGWLWPGSA